jgi:hypothetical protein
MKTTKGLISLLATILGLGGITIVVIVIVAPRPAPSQPESPTTTFPAPNPVVTPLGSRLLTVSDMGEVDGGFWSSNALSGQTVAATKCFPVPTSATPSAGVELVNALGAKVAEVVVSFPTTAEASQAYGNFASATSPCSWRSTVDQVTTQFSTVQDTNVQTFDSASTLWQVQGELQGSGSGGTPGNDGAVMVVRAGSFDAFAYIAVDPNNDPDLPTIESSIAPEIASQLASNS